MVLAHDFFFPRSLIAVRTCRGQSSSPFLMFFARRRHLTMSCAVPLNRSRYNASADIFPPFPSRNPLTLHVRSASPPPPKRYFFFVPDFNRPSSFGCRHRPPHLAAYCPHLQESSHTGLPVLCLIESGWTFPFRFPARPGREWIRFFFHSFMFWAPTNSSSVRPLSQEFILLFFASFPPQFPSAATLPLVHPFVCF